MDLNQSVRRGDGTPCISHLNYCARWRVSVTVSDLTDQMLTVARQNVVQAGFETAINLVLRDCKQLPEAVETFDVVMSNSIVHHIPEPRRVLAELWRVLKPGGLFFVRDLVCVHKISRHWIPLVKSYAGDRTDINSRCFANHFMLP